MSVTNRRSILRRDRRSFVARAMGLSPIGDIASGGMTETVGATTLTWETATVWDNAVDQKSVLHAVRGDKTDDTVVELGVPPGYAASGQTAPELHYTVDESSGPIQDLQRSVDASVNGATLDVDGVGTTTGASTSGGDTIVENTGSAPSSMTGNTDATLAFVAQLTNPTDGNWHEMVTYGTANDNEQFAPTSSNDNTWQFNGFSNDPDTGVTADGNVNVHVVSYDSANNDLLWYLNGNDLTNGGISFPAGTMNFGTSEPIHIAERTDGFGPADMTIFDELLGYGRLLTTEEINYLSGIISDGYIETATKSFGSSATPDLQNLDYSLNGETIDLDVIGSPGTASEEIITQTLDGSASYTLTWSGSHTDFRVKPNISTTTPTTSPTVNRLELVN